MIFNDQLRPKQEIQAFLESNSNKKPAFRFYREPRVVSVDPGTYTNSEKSVNFTCVRVEDVQYPEGEENSTESEEECNKAQGRKSDYDDYSSVGDANMDHKKPVNPSSRRHFALVKKVSFVDEKDTRIKWHTTERNFERNNLPNSAGKSLMKNYSREKEMVGKKENGIIKRRPRTSSGIRRKKNEESARLACKDDATKRRRRPYTAPPSSPALVRDQEDFELFEQWLASVKERRVIKIPTSEIENASLSNTPENDGELVQKDSFETIETVTSSEKTPPVSSCLRVSFTSKSAPSLRSPTKSPVYCPHVRCSSSHLASPSLPLVQCSDASLELPKNLPPAQALIALRKNIRDELAKQNRELELDIQQLYLRKHPY